MYKWDAFISHAFEDIQDFVQSLNDGLCASGLKVWFNEFRVGDSIRESIDEGLMNSRWGIVVVSPAFLKKIWPGRELDALAVKERNGTKVILPVWHNLDLNVIGEHSLLLAGRWATSSELGVDRVVADLLLAMDVETDPELKIPFEELESDEQHVLKMLFAAFAFKGFDYPDIGSVMNISERFPLRFQGLINKCFIVTFIDSSTQTRHFRLLELLTESQLRTNGSSYD